MNIFLAIYDKPIHRTTPLPMEGIIDAESVNQTK